MTYEKGLIKHSEPVKLLYKKWLLCYCIDYFDLTNELFDMLLKVSGKFGAVVEEPEWCEVERNSKEREYIHGFKYLANPKVIQVVVVII
jgi:hypothetical protein